MPRSYRSRLLLGAVQHPVDTWDRVRGRVELWRDRERQRLTPTTADLVATLHQLLDMQWPCSECAGFEALWEEAIDDLEHSSHRGGTGYDAGRTLAAAAYSAVRHRSPQVAIETGVARGVTSRFLLLALRETSHGILVSIDLPPYADGWHGESAIAVPEALRSRWDYRRGSSRRLLPPIVAEHEASLGLFVHDSLHTTANVLFELRTVWPALAVGDVVLVDDVEDNAAFSTFVEECGDRCSWAIAQEQERSGMVGVIVKRCER